MSKNSPTTRTKNPAENAPDRARIREALSPLLDALTAPDEGRRREAVAYTLAIDARVRACASEHLIDLLQTDGAPGTRATRSLAELGMEAETPLYLRLCRTTSEAFQLRLVETLFYLGMDLPPGQRMQVEAGNPRRSTSQRGRSW